MRNPANEIREFGLRFEEAVQEKSSTPHIIGTRYSESDLDEDTDDWAAMKGFGLLIGGVTVLSVIVSL